VGNENFEAMLAGERYDATDPIFGELKQAVTAAKAQLDQVSGDDMPARIEACTGFFGGGENPCLVLAPFNIQFGHVRLGKWTFINFGATFLDANFITLGDQVAVGPNVQFITDTHPVKPEERFAAPEEGDMLPFKVINYALPIVVHDYVWIGAGAIIMPGVTIGEGAMVGAGSVVTRNVAPRTIVAGNPARLIRHMDD
jgi:maltose O-acetyltransferase